MELDYLLYSKVSPHWTLVRDGATTLPIKYSLQGGGCLVKCCNFLVNLGHSLGRDLMVEFMFNLGLFPLEDNPSLYMREFHCIYVDLYFE